MSNPLDRRRVLGGLAALAAAPACAGAPGRPVTTAPPTPAATTTTTTATTATAATAAGAGAGAAAAAAPSYPALPPLGDGVFARRRDRLCALARQAGANLVFVTSGTTAFAYLAGGRIGRSERLIAMVIPVRGEPFLIAPAFEAERMRRETRVRDVRPWEEHEDPYAAARDGIASAGAGARILIEPHTEYQTALALGRAVPGARLLDGTAVFEQLRLHKDDDELARIRRAIAITQDAYDAAFAGLRPGMRDRDVSAGIADAFKRAGATGYAMVQFGALSALPHGRPRGDALREGCVVLIDGGCEVDGYWSDITRTWWFGGAPPAEFTRVHGIVRAAQSAAIDRVRPGVAAQDIDRAARDVIEQAGFGAQFTHRVGHGLGMDGHEPAYLVRGNAQKLEPGFVFTVEPGIYLPDQFGVRIEDDVVCGPDGAILLSRRD